MEQAKVLSLMLLNSSLKVRFYTLKGMQRISLQRHLPHKNYGVDDVKVELTFKMNEQSY